MGPLIPLFWTSGDVSSEFQSQSELAALFTLGRGICVTCSQKFTSGATPANVLVVSMVAKPFFCMALVGLKTGIYRATGKCSTE